MGALNAIQPYYCSRSPFVWSLFHDEERSSYMRQTGAGEHTISCDSKKLFSVLSTLTQVSDNGIVQFHNFLLHRPALSSLICTFCPCNAFLTPSKRQNCSWADARLSRGTERIHPSRRVDEAEHHVQHATVHQILQVLPAFEGKSGGDCYTSWYNLPTKSVPSPRFSCLFLA